LSFEDFETRLRFIGGRSRYNAVRRLRARLRVCELFRIQDVYSRSVRSIAAELGWTRWKAWAAREELYRVGVEAFHHPRTTRADLERALVRLEAEIAEMRADLNAGSH
jgi:hypothetical protein